MGIGDWIIPIFFIFRTDFKRNWDFGLVQGIDIKTKFRLASRLRIFPILNPRLFFC